MMFKDLQVGATFEFDHSGLPLGHGLASGPWRKLSARAYIPVDDRWNGEHARIGSTRCKVVSIDLDAGEGSGFYESEED